MFPGTSPTSLDFSNSTILNFPDKTLSKEVHAAATAESSPFLMFPESRAHPAGYWLRTDISFYSLCQNDKIRNQTLFLSYPKGSAKSILRLA